MILCLVVDCRSVAGRHFVTALGVLHISFVTVNRLESFHRRVFQVVLQRRKKKKNGDSDDNYKNG